tara:strand:- start:130 stop:777 length:648 start_codon:yes stop_codon:yes gene_type:complete
MPDYQKAKIYKIWSPQTEKVYVGATIQTLSMRMTEHRKPTSTTSSSKIIIGLGDAKIELLEEYPCNNKMELDKKEGEYIRKLDCVNKIIVGRTKKEYHEDNKEHSVKIQKEYRDNNKENIVEKSKEYYDNNKEIIAEKRKDRYEKNKESVLIKAKIYRDNNKEKAKIYKEANKEKLAEKKKAYREANIEKIREYDRARGVVRRAKAKLEKFTALI